MTATALTPTPTVAAILLPPLGPPPTPPAEPPGGPNLSDPIEVLARTLYGEARGEPVRGQEAVACVILNRVARATARGTYWWGNSIVQVCLKPWQFSCWNRNDPNRPRVLAVTPKNRAFASCLRIARRAVRGGLEDFTFGATHYHTTQAHPPWAWNRSPCLELGGHLFYNTIE